VIIYLATVINC